MPPKKKTLFVGVKPISTQARGTINAAKVARFKAQQTQARARDVGAQAAFRGQVGRTAASLVKKAARSAPAVASAVGKAIYHGVPPVVKGAISTAKGIGAVAGALRDTASGIAQVAQTTYRAGAHGMRAARAANRFLEERGIGPADAARFIGRSALKLGSSALDRSIQKLSEMGDFLRNREMRVENARRIAETARQNLEALARARGALTPSD